MTGQRDIDRTLDAWFVDGPSVMPDRLFDAVLDQVGHTHQRPLARLTLRLREMNPKIRLYTVLAAALLVVVAAIAVIGGGATSPVKSTDAPTSRPSTAPSTLPSIPPAVLVPPDLAGTWMGGHRPIVTDDPDAGVSLVFDAQGQVWMTPPAQSTRHLLLADVTAVDGVSFHVVTRIALQGCAAGDVGEYTWAKAGPDKVLELTLVNDACASRAESMPGTYWLMECPTEDDNCLGPLPAGTYESQFIDPFVGPGGTWSPRFGALTYTVPDGWVNVDDWPAYFTLAPEGASGETALSVWTDIVAASDLCAQTQATGVGESAGDLATWVAGLAGVNSTSPEQLLVAGLDAWRVDVSLKPSWAKECFELGGFVGRGLFTDRSTDEGFGWILTPGTRARMYFVDLGDGRAMVVNIQSDRTGASYETFVAEATAIAESMAIPAP